MLRNTIAFVALLASVTSVARAEPSRRRAVVPAPATNVTIFDDFRLGQLGWEAAFADYSPESAGMDLASAIRALPPELGMAGTAFFITGNNHSDDLFMFMVKKLSPADGVRPNQRYTISFRVTLASQAGSGCSGIGGSPGDSVYLKAGATAETPAVSLQGDNHYHVNFDKGNQAVGGPAATVLGVIANGTARCDQNAPFVSIVRTGQHQASVLSNRFGELWLIVGTDSAFEGITALYYQSIEAVLTPLNH